MLAIVNTETLLPGQVILALCAERNWTQAELARRAGHHRAVVHSVIVGRRGIGRDLGADFAKAFGMSPDLFFRKIGIFPSNPEADETLDQIHQLYSTLQTEQSKSQALEYMRFLILQEERAEYNANPKSNPPGKKK